MEQKAGAQISQRAFIQSLVILFMLMMVAGILTLVIPAGQYTRVQVDGRETIDPDSFQFVEKPDYPIWRWFIAPLEVLGSSSGLTVIVIIVVLFFAGGAFAVMDKTGTLRAFIGRIVRRFRDRKYTLLWIEGYVGSAMLKVFMDEFTSRLDVEKTGLLLVHAINPWGMKHHYRVNPHHVDLNRNFVFDDNYSTQINPDYDLIADLLNPGRPVGTLNSESIPFLSKVIRNMIHPGKARVQAAALLGQHRHSKGIYFGGTELQEETSVLMRLYRAALQEYQNFIQVDIHTGYGPRYQMTIIIPPCDPIPSVEFIRNFNYSLVQKIDANEFYAINGDMGDYVDRLRDTQFPDKNVFACGFEFGTFGDSLPALIRSLRITVLENQLRHQGARSQRAEEQIRAEYEELFFPSETRWREMALADCRQAFRGILTAFGIR